MPLAFHAARRPPRHRRRLCALTALVAACTVDTTSERAETGAAARTEPPADATRGVADAFRFHDLGPGTTTPTAPHAEPPDAAADTGPTPDAAATCSEAECRDRPGVCDRGECLPLGPPTLPPPESPLYFAYELHLTLPDGAPDCCADLNGDARPDNRFGEAMRQFSRLAGDPDFPYETLQQGADIRQYVLLIGLGDSSDGTPPVSVYYGMRLSPALPGPDDFNLLASSLVEGTSVSAGRAAEATRTDDAVGAEFLSPFPMRFDLSAEFSIVLPLMLARLDARWERAADGRRDLVGRITGAVPLGAFAGEMSRAASLHCGCLGLGDAPLMTWAPDTTDLHCTPLPDETPPCDLGDARIERNCVPLGVLCRTLVRLLQPDLATHTGAAPDAFSFALTFRARPARLVGIDPR